MGASISQFHPLVPLPHSYRLTFVFSGSGLWDELVILAAPRDDWGYAEKNGLTYQGAAVMVAANGEMTKETSRL